MDPGAYEDLKNSRNYTYRYCIWTISPPSSFSMACHRRPSPGYLSLRSSRKRDTDSSFPTSSWESNTVVNKSAFFGAALKDPPVPAVQNKAATAEFASKLTVVDFDTDRWVMFADPEDVNVELAKWFRSLNL
ncbi:hypothetical protein DFH11DRAFT_1731325 [Phellopilus nigrolimitatus]|nr:hypothetical protein DFH11DRAFT_1731325 [Phellopilus nigrolimitatus]